MRDKDLFQMALGLMPPWLVENCKFDLQEKRLDIYIDFPRGAKFTCPQCGRAECGAYDVEEKTWRHLNFFEHNAYLHARVPRSECPECGVKTVSVPWGREGSGFTLLFEAFVMTLVCEMPVNAIARLVGEHDTRLWRILNYYVEKSRAQQDYSRVSNIGIDETSSKRGHNYISLFVDLDESKVLFATEGKDAKTVAAFSDDLKEHGGDPAQIEEVCCDMSPAFINGIENNFENAHITFDRFHVMKVVNEAVDKVRREETKDRIELKGSRYVFLKNPDNLTIKQQGILGALNIKSRNLKTVKAYHIKLNFQELFLEPTKELAEIFLKKWYFWATHSRIEPVIEAAKTIKRHWDGVLRWFKSRVSNGVLEGINSLVQAAKNKARGFRNTKNFITIAYLVAGKLDFSTHTK